MSDDILEPNPFANSILATEGDSDASAIHQAVGLALDRWERCETEFTQLYCTLINAAHGRKWRGGNLVVLYAFGAVIAPSTRRDMIISACDTFLESRTAGDAEQQAAGLREQTRKLLNLYRQAAARRNEIAHGIEAKDNPRRGKPPLIGWFLLPSLFATRKNEPLWGGPKYRYTTREIGHLTTYFDSLGSRAHHVSQGIHDFAATLP